MVVRNRFIPRAGTLPSLPTGSNARASSKRATESFLTHGEMS